MESSRNKFYIALLATTSLLFLAGALEHAGLQFLMASVALTLSSAVGSLFVVVLAFRAFWTAISIHTIPAAIGLACSPFVVGGLLTLIGTAPNVHGAMIGGLLFFALLSEVTAITLLASLAVRTIMKRR